MKSGKKKKDEKAQRKTMDTTISDVRQGKAKTDTLFEGMDAELRTFDENPFRNCHTLIQFYRQLIRSKNAGAGFTNIGAERRVALEVLDLMIENKRETVHFLRGWINYFVAAKLTGNSICKPEKTSLFEFKKSFNEFNSRYLPPV